MESRSGFGKSARRRTRSHDPPFRPGLRAGGMLLLWLSGGAPLRRTAGAALPQAARPARVVLFLSSSYPWNELWRNLSAESGWPGVSSYACRKGGQAALAGVLDLDGAHSLAA